MGHGRPLPAEKRHFGRADLPKWQGGAMTNVGDIIMAPLTVKTIKNYT
jgi:hypothetical protein